MSTGIGYLDFALDANSQEVGSTGWWRGVLERVLDERRLDDDLISRYMRGDHPTAFATQRYREAFGAMLAPLRDDWLSVVVEAATERLIVDGLRGPARDETGDNSAWEIWQENGLDARMPMGFDEAVKYGCCHLVVSPGDTPDDAPVILVVPASRAVVRRDPSRPLERQAGMHAWVDEDGRHIVVWTRTSFTEWFMDPTTRRWEKVDDRENVIGVVPIIPMANRPTLRFPDGQSDVRDILPLQDAINKLLADLMVASEWVAFPQRWATGLEIPTDPATGQQIDGFVAALNRLWTVESENTKFGEFSAANLQNYTDPIELIVRHIAAHTRTPPHYLMGNMANASAEALKAAEAGLVSRVRAKQQTFGEGIEEAIRLAFAFAGDTERATYRGWETIWRDPETRTEAERVDALTKLASIGVPQEALWMRIPGVTPQEIERWRVMRDQEALAMGLSVGQLPVSTTEPPQPPPPVDQQGG